jgi:hypothetical protein
VFGLERQGGLLGVLLQQLELFELASRCVYLVGLVFDLGSELIHHVHETDSDAFQHRDIFGGPSVTQIVHVVLSLELIMVVILSKLVKLVVLVVFMDLFVLSIYCG